ncbi:MAG: SDR family oxidoreductase [Kiritimatiellae bacterium]|nr:SDR family oxidoreductase [Kiritimatiellia bacterium]
MNTGDAMFELRGQVAALTGAGGVLISRMARELGRRGVTVIATDRNLAAAESTASAIRAEGGSAEAIAMDVTDPGSLQTVADELVRRWGRVDILINGAGGNRKDATPEPGQPFFDLPAEALRSVVDLNLMGTVLPSQVFGREMAKRGCGAILNLSSMTAIRPISRVVGYGAAKAAVDHFTRWLAVHLAQTCAPAIRVNAIAPGFFLTEQNRFLLTNESDGSLTERGRQVLSHTPMNRFGAPEDLLGAMVWLLSPSASFVTGVVLPIDGGFSVCAGV